MVIVTTGVVIKQGHVVGEIDRIAGRISTTLIVRLLTSGVGPATVPASRLFAEQVVGRGAV